MKHSSVFLQFVRILKSEQGLVPGTSDIMLHLIYKYKLKQTGAGILSSLTRFRLRPVRLCIHFNQIVVLFISVTIIRYLSTFYLFFGFTSFLFKYPYHEITKSANISNQCDDHHNNRIHRHSSYLLSIIRYCIIRNFQFRKFSPVNCNYYFATSSSFIAPFAVLALNTLERAIPTTITTTN